MALVGGLFGCGGGEWSTEQAGREYELLIEPHNDVIHRVADVTDLTELVETCQEGFEAANDLMRGLEDGQWPETAADEVDKLIGAVADESVAFHRCMKIETEVDLYAYLESASGASFDGSISDEAQELRTALDLPPLAD